jgi:hypothetical protein
MTTSEKLNASGGRRFSRPLGRKKAPDHPHARTAGLTSL